MNVLGPCTFEFFISGIMTLSGMRLTTVGLNWPRMTLVDSTWPLMCDLSEATGITRLICVCGIFCFLSCLLAALIFDRIFFRRFDSFSLFSIFLKHWPVKNAQQNKLNINSKWTSSHLSWANFGWHVSALIFMSCFVFIRFLESAAYRPILTLSLVHHSSQ